MNVLQSTIAALALLGASGSLLASVTTFDTGNQGWGVFFSNEEGLGDFLEPAGGNPGSHLRWTMIDAFGCSLRNDTNPDTIGDYRRFSQGVTLSVDVKVDSIQFFGNEVPRNLIVELVDPNPAGSTYPYTSVWFNLGEISLARTRNWTRFSVTIADPGAAALPAGWGGTGDEDPGTFEPRLPPGRTFSSVLASVDEIRFTTFQPGFFYGFTNFQVRFDNVSVVPIPAPGATVMLGFGGLAVTRRRRSS
jgi:MYXO-CTERM domain-containing protein